MTISSTYVKNRVRCASWRLRYDRAMAAPDAVDDRLCQWIARHRRAFALTGAGCSTA
jgi:hypothetical protein